MFQKKESIGETKMVTNAEVAKKVNEKEEENRFLRDRLAQLEEKLDQVEEKNKEFKGKVEEKKKQVAIQDEEPTLDQFLIEETFFKALKAMSGKALEGIPLFSRKMEEDLVMDQIEGMENHFECDGVTE